MTPDYTTDEFNKKCRKFLEVIVDNGIKMGEQQALYEANPNRAGMIKIQEIGREIGRMSENLLINIACQLENKEDKCQPTNQTE